MIKSLSVVLPVFNCEKLVTRALKSIEASLNYFYLNNPNSNIDSEIVVVNDGSTDGTSEALRKFTCDLAKYIIIENKSNLGIGVARNIGVKESSGEIIFHCDGDDLYLIEHILVCYNSLNFPSNPWEQNVLCYSLLANIPDCSEDESKPFGAVKTKVRVREPIHPYWRSVINYCHTLNLCVRRECHDFIEGLPEDFLYKELRQDEDTVYNQKLGHFFKICRIDIETVQYFRYPGNCLDRQMNKFQVDPKSYIEDLSEREFHLRNQATEIYNKKIVDLSKKFEDFIRHNCSLD